MQQIHETNIYALTGAQTRKSQQSSGCRTYTVGSTANGIGQEAIKRTSFAAEYSEFCYICLKAIGLNARMVGAEPRPFGSVIELPNNKTFTSKGFNPTVKVTGIRGAKILPEQRKLEGKTFSFLPRFLFHSSL